MDTKEFFDLILPSTGKRCIAYRGGSFTHYYGDTNTWAAEAAHRLNARGADVYHGCASYKSDSRQAANVQAVRSFWLDIDTQESKPREKYATRKDAVVALTRFVEEIDLPDPYIVSSGNGIHAYWPCDEDMTPEAWVKTARLLKKACVQWGLASDPSRTADVASILRPVEMMNRKQEPHRMVRVVRAGEVTSHAYMHCQLESYVDDADDELPIGSATSPNLNSDLMVKTEYAPADAHKIAEHCAVIAEMRDTLGAMDQPTWYGCIGVVAFTEQGEAQVHEWSKGDKRYSVSETTAKYNQARQFAPTTCAKLADNRPDVCAACPHFGKIKSPISLGTERGEPKVIPQEMLPSEPMAMVSKARPDFPKGFNWGMCEDGSMGLYREVSDKVEDDSGNEVYITKKVKFSDVLFYPINRVRGVDSNYSMNIFMRHNNGTEVQFMLDNGVVMEGGRTLFSELGRKEIAVQAKNKPDVTAYLTAWISKLRDEYTSNPSVEQFGWVDRNFVVGPTMITKDGPRKAILTRGAASKSQFFEPKGSLDKWVECVDRAYNRPGCEPLQFIVLTGFASALMHLLTPNNGVFVHAYSSGSGKGKTTAQYVAMSVWGFYPELLLREGAMATANAIYNHFGVLKNLPVVIDEMTTCSNQFATEIVYNASSGQGKKRLTADGMEKKMLGWSTIITGSSNNMLAEKLSLTRAQAEAEMMRVFEFRVTPTGNLPTHEADRLFPEFLENHGWAGRAFIEYVVANYDTVRDTLMEMREKFGKLATITQAERYWSALHACVLTSLGICRKLGLIKFDPVALRNWIIVELKNNRDMVVEASLDPRDQFAEMIADLWSGMLVTIGEGNLSMQSGAAIVEKHPYGKSITGRSIIDKGNSMEKLFISLAAAKEWCNQRKVSFKDMQDTLISSGWVSPTIRRVSLGKGTVQYAGVAGPIKALEVNAGIVRAAAPDSLGAQKITGMYDGGMSGSRRNGTND